MINEIKEIAAKHDDLELFKFACELEKEGALGLLETFNAAKSAIKGTGKAIVNAVEKKAPGLASVLSKDVTELGAANVAAHTATMASKVKPIKRAYQSGVGAMAVGR